MSYRPGSITARTAQLPRLDFHAVAAPSHNHPHTHRYHHPSPPNAAPIVARPPHMPPPPQMTRRSLVFTNEGVSMNDRPRCYEKPDARFGRTWGAEFGGNTDNCWASVGVISPRVPTPLRAKVLGSPKVAFNQCKPTGYRYNSGYTL